MEEFKVNDYIVVCINTEKWADDTWNNVCFKQRCNSYFLNPLLDLEGSSSNGWNIINFKSIYWRYATEQEIQYYNEIEKPFNINIKFTVKPIKLDYTRLLNILKFIQNHEIIFASQQQTDR